MLCHVLGSVSHLHASKTSSPSALCAEALCQSLVKPVGRPTTTGGLWTWVWEKKEANCYQPLWFCQELPCMRKDFPVLGIKPTHKKNSPALEIFGATCIGHWLDLVTSRTESIEPFCLHETTSSPLSWNWERLAVFVASGKKKRTGSLLTSVSELSFIVYSVWVCWVHHKVVPEVFRVGDFHPSPPPLVPAVSGVSYESPEKSLCSSAETSWSTSRLCPASAVTFLLPGIARCCCAAGNEWNLCCFYMAFESFQWL